MLGEPSLSQLVLFEEFTLDRVDNPNGRAASAEAFTERQAGFMDRYMATMNGAQAARDVGVPEGSARYAANKWLSNPYIRSELRRRMGERMRAAQLSVDGVLEQLRRLAFSDIRSLYDDDGRLKPMSDWPGDIAARVAGVETEELFSGRGDMRHVVGRTVKVKLWNPNEALNTIAKHLKMIVDQHALEVTGSVELADASDDELRDRARAIAQKALPKPAQAA